MSPAYNVVELTIVLRFSSRFSKSLDNNVAIGKIFERCGPGETDANLLLLLRCDCPFLRQPGQTTFQYQQIPS